MKLSALNPFRFRALLPGVLAVGLILGIWLGDLFKGLGWGPGPGGGDSAGTSKTQRTDQTADDHQGEADLVGVRASDPIDKSLDHSHNEIEETREPGPVRVLIDGRNYFVQRGKKREAIRLEDLIERIRDNDPNEDGIRAVIDLTQDSRPSAEETLKKSLRDAGLTDAVYWPGRAVE